MAEIKRDMSLGFSEEAVIRFSEEYTQVGKFAFLLFIYSSESPLFFLLVIKDHKLNMTTADGISYMFPTIGPFSNVAIATCIIKISIVWRSICI